MRSLGLCALLMLGFGSARAGRRLLAWPYDTETLPQRGVEIEQWIWEKAKVDDGNVEAWLWLSPVVGITDELELALPIEWQWQYGLPTQLETYGLDLRWRLSPSAKEAAWPIVPLLRAGVKRHLANVINGVGLELDAVVSADIENRAHFVIDVGLKDLIQGSEHTLTVDFLAGGTVLLGEGIRVGATLWAQVLAHSPAGDDGLAFIAAGPDLSFSHGRFWATAGIPISLHRDPGQPRFQPRLTWGILF